MDKTVGIAVVGCGTVGGSTADLLIKDEAFLRQRSGCPVKLKYIVDLNFDYARKLGLPENLYEEDLQKALDDEEVSIIIELIGGLTVAKKVITRSLKAGKNVVTANKALLAHYGPELFALARENGVAIGFEASCGGGIPVIKALTDGLLANRIDAIYGIVNGTCNYILTEMGEKGQSFRTALEQAQKDGLAEADPTLDISGMDSAHKITIMSSLAFGQKTELDSVPVSGIDTLDLFDVQAGKELGYVVKLLAMAWNTPKGLVLQVAPAFLSTEHPLARVSGPFNAVSIYGHAVGHTMYMGRGAGGSPTASAVASDILAIALGITGLAAEKLGFWPDQTEEAKLLSPDEVTGRYYLRIQVKDHPGVIAKISTILADEGISLTAMVQNEAAPDDDSGTVPIILTTHDAQYGNIRKGLETIDALDDVSGLSVCIQIIDEHEEFRTL